jgi:hypothetical protein
MQCQSGQHPQQEHPQHDADDPQHEHLNMLWMADHKQRDAARKNNTAWNAMT